MALVYLMFWLIHLVFKLVDVLQTGMAGFHNLWSQDFENAQCLEETQVGYTQDEKRFTHTPYITPPDQ